MKPMAFRNQLNGERFVCEDIRAVEVIDGIEYLLVHRPDEFRTLKIRKDVLIKDTTVVKGKSRDPAKV